MRASTLSCGLLLLAVSSLACSWVPLSEGGEQVRLVANNEVADCDRMGTTRASVLQKVWFVPRRRSVVRRELETLARNEGGKIGGNTVTPLPSRREGQREFAVYRCDD